VSDMSAYGIREAHSDTQSQHFTFTPIFAERERQIVMLTTSPGSPVE